MAEIFTEWAPAQEDLEDDFELWYSPHFLFHLYPPALRGPPQPESAGHALRFSVKAGIAVVPPTAG